MTYSKIKSENLYEPIHDIINYFTSICPFESGKCGKDGKRGWLTVLEFLEFLELFLNCKRFLKNHWNNEFLRICSWNVLEFYFSSFIKNWSFFSWFILLKLMPFYRFQTLFYDAKTFIILFLLIFVFHEICLCLIWD